MEWREHDGIRWLEASLPGAKTALTTRVGGASEPPFASLNLGILTGDEVRLVRGNRRRLASALELSPERVLIGRQVHGAEVANHAAPQSPSPFADPGPDPPQVDGHVVAEPDLAPLVFVADCLPVAVAGPGGVAMLHCGWRGLAAGIIERGVQAVDAPSAAVDAPSAAVGPGIGPCCYEVGPEVTGAFVDLGAGIAEGRMLDLNEVARRLLARAGVESTEIAGMCTKCNPDLFFSHRRDGERTGRQAGLVWLVDRSAARWSD